MSTTTRHILIIGGGLAGPCLALSLARRNIRSTIFEIRPTRSDMGGSISLGPNALQVLDRYAGVYDQIRAAGFSYHRFGAYADDGEKFGEIAAGEEGKGAEGYPSVRIMRSTLHKRKTSKGVTAYFEDGSNAKGDILIGADGMHSKVRQHVLGSEAPTPTFDGMCIVYGFLPASSAIPPSADFAFPAFMFTPSGVFMTIPIDPEGKTLAWVINQSVEERSRDEWRELERSGEAARLAKADYDDIQTQPVRSLLDNADETKARLWAAYSIPELPKWHKSRVCLIGDAAHGLPPNGGQGSAMAFEDAAILTRLLTSKDTTNYDQLFRQFEAIRRPRIKRLRQLSKASGAAKAKSGRVGWYVKKWAFRAFFAWNRGVLQHAEQPTYDVDQVNLEV
ncbi:putative kynurenine 3-monooxygenase [Mycena venus]|uniref:Putative kynurenine 3-monooxygenase n=1 Tax=Mycena venus TaxID=2733690 RepID=A0A8H6TZJ7_9AGAR|nr:putative kynurenine 3-monooxygenase [Mycena venus]